MGLVFCNIILMCDSIWCSLIFPNYTSCYFTLLVIYVFGRGSYSWRHSAIMCNIREGASRCPGRECRQSHPSIHRGVDRASFGASADRSPRRPRQVWAFMIQNPALPVIYELQRKQSSYRPELRSRTRNCHRRISARRHSFGQSCIWSTPRKRRWVLSPEACSHAHKR